MEIYMPQVLRMAPSRCGRTVTASMDSGVELGQLNAARSRETTVAISQTAQQIQTKHQSSTFPEVVISNVRMDPHKSTIDLLLLSFLPALNPPMTYLALEQIRCETFRDAWSY
jgi:hypothetical protein